MKKRSLCLILSVCVFLMGCTKQTNDVAYESETTVSDDVSWELNYEVPKATVNVLVDQEGYYIGRDKKVCFRGDDISDTFEVIDALTDEVVYTGNISDKHMGDADDEMVSVGDFTEFETPGTYYIQTDIYGRSYSFTIDEKVYDDLFEHMIENSIFYPLDETKETIVGTSVTGDQYRKLENRKDVYEECMAITAQALAMQYYGDCFEQKDGVSLNVIKDIQQEATWLLSMQDDNGLVHAGLYKTDDGQICRALTDDDATAAFGASMAILSKVFETTDTTVSSQYKDAAKRAYNALENKNSDNLFYVAAWLLWLEGDDSLNNATTTYLQKNEYDITKDKFSLYGGLAYLSAEYKTDKDLCAKIMKAFMDNAEETADHIKDEPYMIYSEDMQENFDRMLIVSIANYIVPSNEYVKVLENYMHFLLGRNPNGYRYIGKDGNLVATTDAKDKTQQWDAIVRLMMCSIIHAQQDS